MKIGIFLEANLAKPGGVQEYGRGLYDYLEKKGHQVCFIVPGYLTQKENREVKTLGKRLELEKITEMIGVSASVALTYAKFTEIKNFLIKEDFDLIHFQAPFGLLGYQLLWIAQQQKIAKVMSFLVFSQSNLVPNLVNFSVGPILRKLSSSFDCQIALSKAAREFARKMFPGKYSIVPAGVDLGRFHSRGEKVKKYLDKKKNILFVGRLDKRKGILVLLKAFALVKEKFPMVRLIIVGKGPEEKKAKRYVRKKKIADVEFIGYVIKEDLPKFYRTADIVCFPTLKDESFGIVLLEAMASGKPVVASRIRGYDEVLKGELSRFLVPPGNVKGLRTVLLNLLENTSLRQKYAQISLEAAEEYSWEKIGERILEFYKTIQ